ncbi:phosphotransferase enzyme family protein [Nocardia sp. NPDC060256]|uniref:phosphotransferase enzyme family protein n=1 Tax=unclassified Nocardia TaxID=2637762 RepID=UPI003646DDBF
MTGQANGSEFTAETARRALESACTTNGLKQSEAELIRLGENAIFILPQEGVVARIARTVANRDRVERELAVARWLDQNDYPAVRVAEHLTQPIEADQRLVTFWHEVDIVGEATLDDLAVLLRDFHALPAPEFTLPQFNPFSAVPTRLADPGNADPDAVAYLTDLYEELRTKYATLTFDAPLGVIHGDAHRGNVMVSAAGPLLSDFEVVAWGPREWDLTTTAMALQRFDLPQQEYESYVRIYGRDVTQWSGFPIMSGVRELTMTTWLMQLVDHSADRAREFAHRIDSLRAGDRQRRWHAF